MQAFKPVLLLTFPSLPTFRILYHMIGCFLNVVVSFITVSVLVILSVPTCCCSCILKQ